MESSRLKAGTTWGCYSAGPAKIFLSRTCCQHRWRQRSFWRLTEQAKQEQHRETTMRKFTAAALCELALIATGEQAQTVKEFMAAVMPKWMAPFEPFQLIGNIYY